MRKKKDIKKDIEDTNKEIEKIKKDIELQEYFIQRNKGYRKELKSKLRYRLKKLDKLKEVGW